MKLRGRAVCLTGTLAALGLGAGVARPDPLGLVPGYDDPQPAFSWQGQWQSRAVYFRSLRSGASLYGTLFAPAHPKPGTRYPLVLITPGSSVGVQAQYQWSARDLAGHGYVAFTIDPRGAGKSGEDASDPCGPGPPSPSCATTKNNAKGPDYLDAIRSGIAFALSPASPYHAIIDPNEIGAAGHSAGADALSYQQGVDPRLKAIVAWDNLISSTTGDQGNANCTNKPTVLVKPRVPALGEASETCSKVVGPNAKKTGYELWRKHGIPSMEVVFAGTQHTDWAQEDNVRSTGIATGSEQQLHDFEYYTRAWFDLYLRHQPSAAAVLLARTVNGRPRSEVVSSRDHSAAYLPEFGVDCQNLSSCSPPPRLARARLSIAGRRITASKGRLLVPVRCRGNPGSRCDGQLALRWPRHAGQIIGGSQTFRVRSGSRRSVLLTLTARGRRLLRQSDPLTAVLLLLSGIPPDSEHPERVPVTLMRG